MSGWGDCAPLADDGSGVALTRFCASLSGMALEDVWRRLEEAFLPPPARCAVDTALSELAARSKGISLARWLNPLAASEVRCNAALGPLDDGVALRAREAVADGFRLLKVKVGMVQPEEELKRLRELVSTLPADVSFRLDANRAWNGPEAECFLSSLAGLPVEMLEEPLAQPEAGKLAALQAMAGIPLALDETLAEWGMDRVVDTMPVERLVLKPSQLGGLRLCLEWAHRAQAAGLSCVVTTSVDSAVGCWAAIHLAAALNNGLHHGLATSRWLEKDVAPAPRPRAGLIAIGDKPGLGVAPSMEGWI